MQIRGLETEGAQVRIGYDDACKVIDHEKAGVILKSGVEMNVLDEDEKRDEIAFFHQLLQEYFAARRLAKEPNPELVHVEWAVDKVSPNLKIRSPAWLMEILCRLCPRQDGRRQLSPLCRWPEIPSRLFAT
ncbi:MAG: hypothetical protein IPG76_05965 [Acidobacteria bacterium]|nr:hypothetical protein [Acidobacteriota bacterium]